MTVHDDLLDELAAFRSAPAPEAGPELQALFSSVAAVAPSSSPHTARSLPVYKRILAGVPSKIAAGALGALLAGTVGAGALTGSVVLASDDAPAPCVVPVADDAPVEADDECTQDEAAAGDEADEADEAEADDADEADEPAADAAGDEAADESTGDDVVAGAPVDPASVPVPTTQSEAAHTHEFDEACGNHGAYVSAFAHTGEEPECATAARAAAAAATGDAAEVSVVSEDEGAGSSTAAKAEAKSERKAAKASAKSDKSGKGGR